jgi:molybdenum cofactor biosynthesis protein B
LAAQINAVVITVSDACAAGARADASGAALVELLTELGAGVVAREVVNDDLAPLTELLRAYAARADVNLIVTTGGTGLAPRDTTYEAITALLEKRLDGFGELFRMLSYRQVGSAAMLSRAAAGVARGRVIVSLPGAPAAVDLAMRELLVPELGHMVHLVRG